MSEDLSADLLAALGEDGVIKLAEEFGGIRLYVPADPGRSELPGVIGLDHATRLSKMFPGGYIRVPLARELRAARYRNQGATNRDIARRLGITETAVDHLIKRLKKKDPAKVRRKKDTRQLNMFD